MSTMFNVQETALRDAKLITPFCAEDERGAFIKDYSLELYEKNGLHHELKEVFYTISKRGVVRGMHFQRVREQAKAVRCISGCVYDVIADLRPDSPTFMKWQGFTLSGDNRQMLYVPHGFAHGYIVLEDSIVCYQCDEKFIGEYDDGICYTDPDLNIDWPFDAIGGRDRVILSAKDMQLQSFAEYRAKYLTGT